MELFLLPLMLGILALIIKGIYSFYKSNGQPIPRRQYESKAANYLKSKGFAKVQIGKGTNDGGRDVKAYREGNLWLGQCKMLSDRRKVGVKALRELHGVAQTKRARSIFFTTNGYTNSAKDFASKAGIECKVLPN